MNGMTDNNNNDDIYLSDEVSDSNESTHSYNSEDDNYDSESIYDNESHSSQSSVAFTSENSGKTKKLSKLGFAFRFAVVVLASGILIAGGVQISKFLKDSKNELIEYNKKVNLTSITDEEEIWVKHFIDSCTIQKYISDSVKLVTLLFHGNNVILSSKTIMSPRSSLYGLRLSI